MPAESVETLPDGLSHPTEWNRRQEPFDGRVGWISCETRDSHHPIVLRVEWFKLPVIDRPVVGDSIESPDPEIGGVKAGEVGRVEDRSATDSIVVGDRYR